MVRKDAVLRASLKTLLVAASCGLVAVLGLIDYVTGPYLSFLVFYLIPVSLAVWLAGEWAGILLTLMSAAAWFVDDMATTLPYEHPLIPYWNLVAKAAFFIAFVHILAALKHVLERERSLARIDYLTEIANQRCFYETATTEMRRARRYRHPFTLAYLDIDGFKGVNDLFGHKAGDALLRLTARTLKKSLRGEDIIARVGGDEFAVLFPETGYDAARTAIERIQGEFMHAVRQKGWSVTPSIGAVTCAKAPRTFDSLMAMADRLMYAAKRSGKNMIRHEVVGRDGHVPEETGAGARGSPAGIVFDK